MCEFRKAKLVTLQSELLVLTAEIGEVNIDMIDDLETSHLINFKFFNGDMIQLNKEVINTIIVLIIFLKFIVHKRYLECDHGVCA